MPILVTNPIFDVLMIDPPWQQRRGGKKAVRPDSSGIDLEYSTMTVPAIFDLLDTEIFPMAAARHSVFLWTIEKYLQDAEREMEARGYKRHARIVWDKVEGIPAAFTLRYSHEYLLWFYKPHLAPVANAARGKYTTVIRERSRQHSRKPDAAYRLIEALYPNAVKADVFSRERREGWEAWGNQVDFFTR